MTHLIRLQPRIVDKPWGRRGLDPRFGVDPARQVGEIWFEAPAQRPLDLLAKYLFTTERLSVQVHPDDAAARRLGHGSGKDECWIVLDAEPGAELGIGTVRAVDPDALAAAAEDGSIVDLVDWRPVSAGDLVYNPARTVHALGPGLTVLEIQQALDLTYRLFDYGRDRPLHLAEARDVADARPHHHRFDRPIDRSASAVLVDEGPFGVAWCRNAPPSLPPGRDFQLLPIDRPVSVAGEAIPAGGCALVDGDVDALRSDGDFVLAWSAA